MVARQKQQKKKKKINRAEQHDWLLIEQIYRQIYNIRRTQFENFNVSRLILQLALCNILKPYIKLTMKM